jgi:FkbM family methyltransferase
MLLDSMKLLNPKLLRSFIGRSYRQMRRQPGEGFGRDFIMEVKSRLPDCHIRTVFDVGAFIGITAIEFSDAFPQAVVYAFEPCTANFQRMEANLVGKPVIRRHRIAFNAAAGRGELLIEPNHPSMCRLVDTTDGDSEIVSMDTIDQFCAVNGVPGIDLLKVDTEGHELEVLAGATAMLSSSRISIIKAECAVDPDSSYHTSFFSISDILHRFGYRLFGIYDQSEDALSPPPHPRLRRFDAAFISRSCYPR